MRKIPTVFARSDDRRHVINEITPGCEWVAAGEGRATRKWDGVCVMRDGDNGEWWARREVKSGKPPPPNWWQVDFDEITGKAVGWEPASASGFHRFLRAALDNQATIGPDELRPGTYELFGPRINGNPEGLTSYWLARHGVVVLDVPDRSFDGLARWFWWFAPAQMEGIVFYHPDGRMAKIKRRDFTDPASGSDGPS